MFSISLQPISCWLRGFFAFCSSFQFIFMFSILYLLNKEDFHYEHHDRHRPRLLRYQNSALFISGWTYQLRRTRTLHPPRTLRVWRVLFCLWLWAAAYPAGQDVNDNYYLLTLAAIANEIHQRGLPPECSVRIAAGLPLTSFGRDKPKFKDYLLRSKQPVNFRF